MVKDDTSDWDFVSVDSILQICIDLLFIWITLFLVAVLFSKQDKYIESIREKIALRYLNMSMEKEKSVTGKTVEEEWN